MCLIAPTSCFTSPIEASSTSSRPSTATRRSCASRLLYELGCASVPGMVERKLPEHARREGRLLRHVATGSPRHVAANFAAPVELNATVPPG